MNNFNSKKKAALIIGINYFGQKGELGGCLNDVDNLKNILVNKFNFIEKNIVVMTDDDNSPPHLRPTKINIINEINNLVNKKKEGFTDFWFSYSGHGYYSKDENGDEIDGRDEAICPVDYSEYSGDEGLISDDQLYNQLVNKLDKKHNLHIIMDCCHSGTIIDLPYYYKNNRIQNATYRKIPPSARIVKLSGSRDDQTSADIYVSNWQKRAGALTMAFEKIIGEYKYNITYKQLVNSIKSYLALNKFSQVPVLSFSKNNLLNDQFLQLGKGEDDSIEIELEGDEYVASETTYNIIKLSDNSKLFSQDRVFYLNNEKSLVNINISPGKYKLYFKDTYGDGGCKATIKQRDEVLDTIKFNTGKYIEKEFIVKPKIKDELININISGDYYCSHKRESTWNIIDKDGKKYFPEDISFSQPFEVQEHNLKIKKGNYKLLLNDAWGDGGLSGYINLDGKKILVFNFNSGKTAYYDFTI